MSRSTFAPLAAVTLAALLTACGSSSTDSGTTTAAGQCSQVAAAQPQPGRQHLTAPTASLPKGSVWNLKVDTNCGSFVIQVKSSLSPKAAASVVGLAKSGFYDALPIHRISPGFVIQGGDPATNGSGGPGYTTVDTPASNTAYSRAIVAMAKTGADPAGAAGSQFFVVTGEAAQLPPDYAVLGVVVTGMETVDRISAQPIDPATTQGGGQADGAPAKPIVIQKITVTRVS
ncbi:MAG: hypothetical protein F2799_05285 [Actinobacteria bacterium]|uniref:peptidylprolyl isomerase n=1 Tax=freshwater metagenome TaxID=449393 RepID=A0A6J7E1G8_9ZZZZ|nr:hypothetical protein [Actinomycetota bacterium]